MIRNIVFDMGGVLLRFDSRGLARAHTETEDDAKLLWRATLGGAWWHRLDRGGGDDEVLSKMLPDLPERLWPNAKALMEDWDESLAPNGEMVALAEELGENGYPRYLLSNTPWRFTRFRVKLPVLERFDGLVLSCQEGLIKPDPALYRLMFDRYGLKPEECFFIDDNSINIEGARFVGMSAHHFSGDMSALRRDLAAHGVNVSL